MNSQQDSKVRINADDYFRNLTGRLLTLPLEEKPLEAKLVLGEDGSIFTMSSFRSMWNIVVESRISEVGTGAAGVGSIITGWRFLLLSTHADLA